METEPPDPDSLIALAMLPAFIAAAYSIASAAIGGLTPARRVALRDSLTGGRRRALDRFLASPARIEARWLVLRVSGIAITSAWLALRFATSLGSWSWLVAFGVSLGCYALPSELGRRYAAHHAERVAPLLLRVLRPGEWLVSVVADPLAWLATRLIKDVSSRPPSATLTETEVELIVNAGERDGSLAHDQSEMIRNVLDFGDVTAEEVMVPRIHVQALDATLPLSAVLDAITDSQHSRYPVYRDSPDNIVGVLHVKDVFPTMAKDELDDTQLLDLIRSPVAFVPEGQLASTVLKDMRAGRHHMAVIIDEFGGVSGIVTLEDLLEEIVGDIQDEHDVEDERRIHPLGAGRALVDASLPVSDINRELGTLLPEEGDYVSLGGLLLDLLGEVPAPGSSHDLLGLTFTVKEADARHIELVEIAGLPRRS